MRTPLRNLFRPILIAAVAGCVAVVAPVPLAQAATPKYTIAIMGDSWTAGEGNAPYRAGTEGDGCHRSTNAWAYQVKLPDGKTVKQDESAGTALVQFIACTGAQTKHVLTTSWKQHEPQLNSLNPDATHVFLSISGNDLDFGYIVEMCAFSAPTCSAALSQTRDNKVADAIWGLRASIEKIHAKAPKAQIIVTGYASLLGGSAYKIFGTESLKLMKDFLFEYDAKERSAVQALRSTSTSVVFIDIAPTFLGHADGDTTPWIYPLNTSGGGALHPNQTGMTKIAGMVSPLVLLSQTTCPLTTVIKSGMTGACVKEVQVHLNSWGYGLTADGDFGAKTKAAVVAFQKRVGLTADGLVGVRTKEELFTR